MSEEFFLFNLGEAIYLEEQAFNSLSFKQQKAFTEYRRFVEAFMFLLPEVPIKTRDLFESEIDSLAMEQVDGVVEALNALESKLEELTNGC